MKVFVVNLKREPKKREHITRECQRLGLDFEIYDAVDGSTLPEDFLKKNVLDYGHNFLTKGEIGCALSHINLYKKIVEDNLDHALILEDDAVLGDKLNDFLTAFDARIPHAGYREGVYLLTGNHHYVENQRRMLSSFSIYPVRWATMTNGYIITKKAAKTLANFLLPIKFEADTFEVFQPLAGVKVYATIPYIISSNDRNGVYSSLNNERRPLLEKRNNYKNKLSHALRKERTFSVKLSTWVWRLFIRKTEKIKIYYDR